MKISNVLLPVLLSVVIFIQAGSGLRRAGNQIDEGIVWRDLPALPYPSGGHMAGLSNGVLILAGGRRFPAATQGVIRDGDGGRWLDTILALEPGSGEWRTAGRLPHPLAYGAAVSDGESLILLGGSDGTRNYAGVMRLSYNSGHLEMTPLPSLPEPGANFGAAITGRTIFVLGGQRDPGVTTARQTLWSLSLDDISPSGEQCPQWKIHDPLPAPGRILPAMVAQEGELLLFSGAELIIGSDGKQGRRYLRDSWKYNPGAGWSRLADVPEPVVAAPALTFGQSHVLIFGGDRGPLVPGGSELPDKHPGFSRDILSYHTITDTWTKRGGTPIPLVMTAVTQWQGEIIIPGGEERPSHHSTSVYAGRLADLNSSPFGGISWPDYAVLGLYLFATLLVGLRFSRQTATSDDYFLGDRRIPGWAAGLSIYGTQLSAITYLAVPAKTYAEDWTFLLSTVCIVLVMPVVVRFYLPFFRRLNVTTAYEYLEYRFNLAVRLLGSASFIALQLGRTAIVLFLPALALSTVGDLNIYLSILVMGLLTTVYTMKGGIRAVIWTDVLQVFVLLGGAILALIMLISGASGGVRGVIATGLESGKFNFIDWTWDLTAPTVWVMIAGNIATHLIPYTTDQSVVQKYLTTGSEREAARGLRLNALLTIPTGLLFFSTGTALFAFYKYHPELLSPRVQTDATFAWFIANQLPTGVAGLVLAGVFAAAMSTLSSGLNSAATAVVSDFYGRLRPATGDDLRLLLARRLTLLLGLVGTGVATLMAGFEIKSIWELFLRTIGMFGSGLAGVFILGVFTRRAHARGVLIGALTSTIVLFILPRYTDLHFFLHAATAMLTCVAVGYTASLLLPAAQRSLLNLTIHDLAGQDRGKTPGSLDSGSLD